MSARCTPAAAVPGPSRQRAPVPSHRRRPATSSSSSQASPPPRPPRRDDSTTTDSSSSSSTPTTVLPRNPTLARQEITIFFPVLRLVRCPKRGCGTSYGGSSWTARVQSLRRHLETEHGLRIRSKVYVCTVCGETIRARPSYHHCLETAEMPERPPPGQHQCDRCTQSFPSARGLYNHRNWHQTQDAAPRSTGPTRPAPTGPAPQVPPLGGRAETPPSTTCHRQRRHQVPQACRAPLARPRCHLSGLLPDSRRHLRKTPGATDTSLARPVVVIHT
ncbi:hypothetical protein HPB52_023323 [Rhipicephalus sanguineus]|uniref:C2H2-type domain-containing protein n=1 Tax=Rhipicephalus sanguineus TaxID=34632 RepID=A0A9D4QEG1_RHISA|nr:hypothetical protein HPB52_023323 [Rhipicephalus sanguineus]